MSGFGTYQQGARLEDARLLTGNGRFVDDAAPAGALIAMVLRSPVAHGTITLLDVSAARALPGVHLVLTASDLKAAGITHPMRATVLTNRDGQSAAAPKRPILADTHVRHVGEPVAMVVADSADVAQQALEIITLEIEDLTPKLDLAEGGLGHRG